MATDNFYRTPHLTTYSFALGLLLFLLPFAEIKCNGSTMASLKGIDMVTGASPKLNSDFENMGRQFGNNVNGTMTTETKKDGKMYVPALLALLLGVGGLLVALRKKTGYSKAEVVLGIAGAIALVVLMIQVKADVSSQMKAERGTDGDFSDMVKASVDFTFWFFLCVLSYLASAFFSHQQKDSGTTANEQPPRAAPQVPVNNPGDQSDFPASPSVEEGLG